MEKEGEAFSKAFIFSLETAVGPAEILKTL